LVVHSVEGLSYDQVSMISVPADPIELASASPSESMSRLFTGLAFLAFFICGLVLLVTIRSRQSRATGDAPDKGIFNELKMLVRKMKGAAEADS